MKSIEYVLFAFISLFLYSINVYAYKEYEIGEIVSLNDTEFYVIKSSKSDDNYVTALKKEPLKTTEIQEYGEGHINRNTQWNQGQVYNYNGYGAIAYYTSENCGHSDGFFCSNDYKMSDIKYVVDGWINGIFDDNQLKQIDGYKARLIKLEELNENLKCNGSDCYNSPYEWIYESYYGVSSADEFYWTMSGYVSAYSSSIYTIKLVDWGSTSHGLYDSGMIRPVVNILKTALGEADEGDSEEDNIDEEIIEIEDDENIDNDDINYEDDINYDDSNYEISEEVEVPNTLKRLSIIGIVVGIGLLVLSIIVIIRNKNKKNSIK